MKFSFSYFLKIGASLPFFHNPAIYIFCGKKFRLSRHLPLSGFHPFFGRSVGRPANPDPRANAHPRAFW
jgi:hypothetical protein